MKYIRMKQTLVSIFAFVLFTVSAQHLQAQEYKMAIGVRLSSAQATVNNSVTFRYFLNDHSAVEAMASFDPGAIGALYEVFKPLGNTPGFQWYFGGGGYAAFKGHDVLGAQGVVGLDYKFQQIPLNLSLDWKPELNLVDNVNFEAAAVGLAVRFTFH
jgi:hypothetical protein